MAVAGTLRRHGKRLMHEIDFWPDDVAPPWKGFKYWNRPEETVAGNLREVAFALVNGVSWWWFDMWGRMFKNPDVRRNIAKFAKLHAKFAGTLPPPEADILVVADPDSACGMVDPTLPAAPDGQQPGLCPDGFKPARGCGDHIRNVVSRIGATYDTCSFDDLQHIDLSLIRLICLPATWTITPETMRAITESAGCFLYTEELLPVCSNGRLIAVHCGTGGEKRIRLRRRCAKVTDLMTGRTVTADCTEFTDTFASPDTKLYELS